MATKASEATLRSRKKNREKWNAYQRAYQSANPDKVRQYRENRKIKDPGGAYRAEKKLKEKRRANGICYQCGQRPHIGQGCCAECKLYFRNRSLRLAAERIAKGLCAQCGKASFIKRELQPGLYCESCYFRSASYANLGTSKHWKALRDKLINQNYRCPYTGELLVLYGNASVDHIFPVSRFPELRTDPSNVEWVTFDVNAAKRDRTRDEFLKTIKLIYEHSVTLGAQPC